MLLTTLGVLLIIFFFPENGYHFRDVHINPRVNLPNYLQIQPGMTESQVHLALGGPPSKNPFICRTKSVAASKFFGRDGVGRPWRFSSCSTRMAKSRKRNALDGVMKNANSLRFFGRGASMTLPTKANDFHHCGSGDPRPETWPGLRVLTQGWLPRKGTSKLSLLIVPVGSGLADSVAGGKGSVSW